MKTLKIYVAVFVFTAIATATSCTNKNDEVKPKFLHKNDITRAMPQDSTGLSGGQDNPTPPHHP
jgi:hypothetical protein